ncbi:interleukin-27 subunit beta isoform X5 [Globicephala melas]|uniref:interleukin-27 subunit beta isoform X5 n=1 Tax=Globicephala melas TaxID=9731 RepID=UPI00293D8B07|nr:interleukin-27 subunit beta isoform X5 [Globicephala melas]
MLSLSLRAPQQLSPSPGCGARPLGTRSQWIAPGPCRPLQTPPGPRPSLPHTVVSGGYSSLWLGVAAHGESWPCLQQTPEATSCIIPDIQMFSMVPYVLNITAVHPRGVSSSFVPFVPEHVIKPDPPEGVRLSPLPGQRLWVQWEPPRSWPFPEIFSLKYRIRYKRHGAARFRQQHHSQWSKGGNNTSAHRRMMDKHNAVPPHTGTSLSHEKERSPDTRYNVDGPLRTRCSVGPIEGTSFTLKAVRPQAKYCIQVAALDLTDYGESSAWSLPAVASVTLDPHETL